MTFTTAKSSSFGRYGYALSDQAGSEVADVVGTVPGRWGRMTILSRVMIVELGQLLIDKTIVAPGERCDNHSLTVGLIGGTRRGSLLTDLEFIKSMKDGVGMASPALFGYTLPNIPLAEAASHFGLTGPVYALFDTDNPLAAAERECVDLLLSKEDISFMVGCEFDHYPRDGQDAELCVNLKIIGRHA